MAWWVSGAVGCIGVWVGWLAALGELARGQAPSSVLLVVCADFGGGQGFGALIYLNGRAESEMHLGGLFLAGADICEFLYSSIGCLQVYRVYITSF